MERITVEKRFDWQKRVESQGFPFHTNGVDPNGEVGTYWDESVYWKFTAQEVDEIESASEELHKRCLEAVDHICKHPEILNKLGIPGFYHQFIVESWERRDPSIYGRFDLAFDGVSAPKLLEYNADTPTTLIETAVIQWFWLNDVFPEGTRPDQFCSVHEKLIERWVALGAQRQKNSPLYFTAIKDNLEEFATVEYLRDTTDQADLPTKFIYLDDLRWGFDCNQFVDTDGTPIDYLFKLYPWEWMFREEFGKYLPAAGKNMGFLEPPWKAVLSNKGILPILWELFPGHRNLLPAYWEKDKRLGRSWIAKPLFGREGNNMILSSPDMNMKTEGNYGNEPKIFQQLSKLPQRDGQRMVVGSWIIGDRSAGMCVREDTKPIIVNSSKLVPHMFV